MPEIVINNFTRGQLDHDLNGRFDLPFYMNGFEICRNFYSNYKGNIKYRPGLEFISQTASNAEAVLIEFKFNTEQAYLLEFTNNKLRFYTYDANGNFGYVVDNNQDIVELTTGITLAQAKKLQTAQNADVMYLTMNEINPKKLVRNSANSFTISNDSPTGLNFTTDGYPSSVCFYSGRLWYGGFKLSPLKVVASKSADYSNFTVPASPVADDPLALTLAEITDPIVWICGGRQNLYVGNAEGITIVNGGSYDTPITATSVKASLGNHEGTSRAFPIIKDNQLYYISNDIRKVFMFDYDLVTEKFVATDLNWMAQSITKSGLKKIAYKKDNNYNIYGLLNNGQMVALLYNSAESILGWFKLETKGDVVDMSVVTRPDGRDDLFICVLRNGKYYLERLADEVEFTQFYESPLFLEDDNKEYYNRLIAEELKQCKYLDNCQKYVYENNSDILSVLSGNNVITSVSGIFTDSSWVGHCIVVKAKTGKEYGTFRIDSIESTTSVQVTMLSNDYYGGYSGHDDWIRGFYITFNKITGLSDLEGQTLSVVADGGYLGKYTVESGVIQFDREVSSCVVGIPYLGLLKTFNTGDYYNGKNYQTAPKRIAKYILRFVQSAGMNVGTELNNMFEVQYFTPTGFLDLPPLPMDGDERRSVGDTLADWKCIYLTQDKPLPVNLTMIQYNMEFGG